MNLDHPLSTRVRGRILLRMLFLLVLPLIAAAVGAYWYALGGRYVTTDNAYIKADMVAISPSIDGRVVLVEVKDNQAVRENNLLFKLDPRPHAIALKRAEARMVSVRNQVTSKRAQYAQYSEQVKDAEQRVKFLQRRHQRQRDLDSRGMTTAATLDEVAYEVVRASQDVKALGQQGQQVLAELGGVLDSPIEEHPMYLEALAERDAALLALEYTDVRAPADGIVTRVQLQAGEWAEEGRPVFHLMETDDLWVEANLKETQLGHVREGQRVTLEVDTYPDHHWNGQVAQISPATGSEFMLLPPQNATGNWIKVVQRVPIRIEIERQEGRPPLRAGMTVQVSVDTERERELLTTIRAAMASIRGQ